VFRAIGGDRELPFGPKRALGEDPFVGNSLGVAPEETCLNRCWARLAKPRETEGGTGEVLDPGPRALSFFSIISGAANTD
jgi:hypothetical protein